MKNRVINKALCVALASVLMFGEAGPAMAASETGSQSQAVIAEEAEAATIDEFDVGNEYEVDNACVYINASGLGQSAELYVNGVLYDTCNYGYGYWNFYKSFYGQAGAEYTFTVVVTGEDGNKLTKSVTRCFADSGFSNASSSATWMTSTGESGYTKYTGVYIYLNLLSDINSKYTYDIYRSTNAKSGFKKIATCESSTYGGSGCYYTDTTAVYNKTYYYQIKMKTVKDEYNKNEKILSTSYVIKSKESDWRRDVTLSAEIGNRGVDISIDYRGIYNQFDIYRATSRSGRYTKIKTTTRDSYTDTSAKAGKTYFYKVTPRYYDTKTGKLVAGKTTSIVGVKMTMGSTDTNVEYLSSSSVKLSWDKVRGANVYEIWYRQGDISSNHYSKLATTKKTAYTVKGLKPGHTYVFILKAQSVSGGKVKCEESFDFSTATMKYTGNIRNIEITSIKTTLSKDKKLYVIYSTLAWDRTVGASGYIVMGKNNYTGKWETMTKIKTASQTRYKFRNPGYKDKGMKYSRVKVVPYKGKAISTTSVYEDIADVPYAEGVKAKKKSNSSVAVSWKAAVGATSYEVWRTNVQSGMNQYRGETTKTSFEDKDLDVYTTYRYYVKPKVPFPNADNYYYSKYFEQDKFYAEYSHKLGAPKLTGVTNSAAGQMTVKWNKVSIAQNYRIYRATSKNGKYTKIASVSGDNTSYVDKNKKKGTTYYYKVKAVSVSDNGWKVESAASAIGSAKCTK